MFETETSTSPHDVFFQNNAIKQLPGRNLL